MIKTRTIQIAGVLVRFVECPAGSFEMGSNHGLPIEQPIRHVQIHMPFWISTTLVTQQLWASVMPDNPSAFRHAIALPVDGISYDRAKAFCNAAAMISGYRLALPTEAQWEYACRAGTTNEYFWGSSPSEATRFGWFDMNAGDKSHEVAALEPNPWGLYDIVGNLWEWCDDVWHGDYNEASLTGAPWNLNAGQQTRRCLRGGAWDMDVFRLRSAYRSCDHKELATSRFGMRITIVG